MKIKIITDSTSDLTKEEIKRYNISVLPVTATIDGVEYNNIDNEEYIYKMRTAQKFFTSQPAIGLFLEEYKKWTDEGYKIISIHLSSAISGTYSTALSASKEFNDVYVVDSKTASRGIKYFIDDCYNYINQGFSIDEILKHLNEKTNKVLTYVTIDKLDNLVKGGRLKKTSGLIGGILNLKILTRLYPDELVAVEKVRGKKKLISALFDNIKKEVSGEEIQSVSLANVLSEEYVSIIVEEFNNQFDYKIPLENIVITTPAISTHAGEGAVGVIIELK